MSLTREQVADALTYVDNAVKGAEVGAPIVGIADPTIALALVIAEPILALAAQLARAGLDPVEHITRVVDLDALLNAARSDVDKLEAEKFGK